MVFRRRRNLAILVVLGAVPVLIGVAVKVGDHRERGDSIFGSITHNGLFAALAAFLAVLPLFLPLGVAVVAGDAISGEANTGTLRYLLTRPVSRSRLLVAKLVAVLAFVLLAVIVVAGTGFLVGKLLLGGQPLTASTAVTSVSGSTLSQLQIALRTMQAIGYVALSMVGVAAMALLLSTFTDSPLSASLGALAFLIGSSLLLPLDAAHGLAPYLPTRYWLSFIDLFRDPILWRNVERGALLQLVYVVVLLGAAWANFSTKDITS